MTHRPCRGSLVGAADVRQARRQPYATLNVVVTPATTRPGRHHLRMIRQWAPALHCIASLHFVRRLL